MYLQKDLEKRYAVLLKKKKDALEVIEDVEHALQERRVKLLFTFYELTKTHKIRKTLLTSFQYGYISLYSLYRLEFIIVLHVHPYMHLWIVFITCTCIDHNKY